MASLSLLRHSILIAVLSLSFLVLSAAPVVQVPSSSQFLTTENVKTLLPQGNWLVEFFSPYCPHCTAFAPTWNEFVESRAPTASQKDLHFGQVDCTLQGDLCDEHDIRGYPTLLLFKDGIIDAKFKGDRTLERLNAWLDDHVSTPQQEPVPPADVTNNKLPTTNPISDDAGLITITSENFTQITHSQFPVFVKFYAPWCGYCKKLAPTWKDLATVLHGVAVVAEVNCDVEKTLCRSQGVQGFPTLKLYSEDEKVEYKGSRALTEMEGFARKIVTATRFRDVSNGEFERIVHDEDVVFLYLYASADDKLDTMRDTLRSLFGEAPVLRSTSPDLLKRYDISPNEPQLLVFKDGSVKELARTSVTSKDELLEWMRSYQYPTLAEFSTSKYDSYFANDHTDLVLMGLIKQDRISTQGTEAAKMRLKDTAKQWFRKGQYKAKFIWINSSTWASWLKQLFGVKDDEQFTRVIAIDPQNMDYYDQDSQGRPVGVDEESVFRLLADINSGSAKRKHSRNMFQRIGVTVTTGLTKYFVVIGEHPFISLFLFVSVSALFIFLTVRGRNKEDDVILGEIRKAD